MSTAVKRTGPPWRMSTDTRSETRATWWRALLACGFLYSVSYAIANDLIAASMYRGYSRMSQAVSELSATAAPSRSFLTAALPLFTGLMIVFGVGVWRVASTPGVGSARENRALRVTGGLLVVQGTTFPLWLLAPMTSREVMALGTLPPNDAGHILLTVVTMLLIVGEIGFGARALPGPFRFYSLLTVVTIVVFGALTGIEAPRVPRGEPTPWMGLFERISLGAWLLWVATLSLVLLRNRGSFQTFTEPRSSLKV